MYVIPDKRRADDGDHAIFRDEIIEESGPYQGQFLKRIGKNNKNRANFIHTVFLAFHVRIHVDRSIRIASSMIHDTGGGYNRTARVAVGKSGFVHAEILRKLCWNYNAWLCNSFVESCWVDQIFFALALVELGRRI